MNNNKEFNYSYIYFVAFVATLGGLNFGFNFSIISGVLPFITSTFKLDELGIGIASGSGLFGCVVGSYIAGSLCDNLGRKKTTILSSILLTIGIVASVTSSGLITIGVYRFIGGVAIGIISVVAPMFISEISPAKIRGTLVTFNQFAITIGILLGYLAAYFLVNTGADNWRWMLLTSVIPSILLFVLAFFLPDTPRWLVSKQKEEKALHVLKKIGTETYANEEIRDIKSMMSGDQSKVELKELLQPRIFKILMIGIGLALFQQFSGINVVLIYAPNIFEKAGFALSDAMFQSIIIGTVNFLFTIVSQLLVDRFGRKTLLLSGTIGAMFSMLLLGIAIKLNLSGMLILIAALAYVISFSITLGPLLWVVVSEIFPNRVRAQGMSIAVLFMWLASGIVSFTFPLLRKWIDISNTILLFACISFIGIFFVWKYIPETKGKSLEQIEKELMEE